MTAQGSTAACIRVKSSCLTRFRSSARGPYFLRAVFANAPLAGIRATSKSKILRVLLSTAIETASGLHFVCSDVMRSSNWTSVAFGKCLFISRSSFSASAARKRSFRTTVFRLTDAILAISRWEAPEQMRRLINVLCCRFFCAKSGWLVACEKLRRQPRQRKRWTHFESEVR